MSEPAAHVIDGRPWVQKLIERDGEDEQMASTDFWVLQQWADDAFAVEQPCRARNYRMHVGRLLVAGKTCPPAGQYLSKVIEVGLAEQRSNRWIAAAQFLDLPPGRERHLTETRRLDRPTQGTSGESRARARRVAGFARPSAHSRPGGHPRISPERYHLLQGCALAFVDPCDRIWLLPRRAAGLGARVRRARGNGAHCHRASGLPQRRP